MKRGLSYHEAMDYVGVKRRTFDEKWRPHLVAIPQGSSLIFDRGDLDRLFDEFKRAAAGQPDDDDAANDAGQTQAQNAPRNGRPIQPKGVPTWAKQNAVSTATEKAGKSINGSTSSGFANAAFLVLRKRKAG